MYVYFTDNNVIWNVGFYDPTGRWQQESKFYFATSSQASLEGIKIEIYTKEAAFQLPLI